jgi:hypothetical protein
LVISKFAIASVLALAAGLLLGSSGLAAVVQGVALLAMAAFAPFALLKLVPVVEAGAVAHLEGLGRRSVRAAERLGTGALGLDGGGVAALAGLGGLKSAGGKVSGGADTGGSSLRPFGEWRPENVSGTALVQSSIGEPPRSKPRPAAGSGSPSSAGPSSGGPLPDAASGVYSGPRPSGTGSLGVGRGKTQDEAGEPDHG